ncbi:MAG: PrgI family protein, partial [Micromonosporaceae bacterium]
MNEHQASEYPAVAMPADVDQPDRVVAGLTTRQAVIIAAPAGLLWLCYLLLADVVPLPVFAAVVIPVMATAVVLAVGRRDGVSLDRWLLAAAGHALRPRRHVPT